MAITICRLFVELLQEPRPVANYMHVYISISINIQFDKHGKFEILIVT